MTKTQKDKNGILTCAVCEQPVAWLQTKAGKWYLVSAVKKLVNTSTRHEYSSKFDSSIVSQVPHFRSCQVSPRRFEHLDTDELYEVWRATNKLNEENYSAELQNKLDDIYEAYAKKMEWQG